MQIVALVYGLPAGGWEVQAYVHDAGYAFAPLPVVVKVALQVDALEPQFGGSLGGTVLNIFGVGIDSYTVARNRCTCLTQSWKGPVLGESITECVTTESVHIQALMALIDRKARVCLHPEWS